MLKHHCEVDRGSVVENATILPHTYLGSGLDITHSIVNRNAMVDLRQAVEVEIGDRSLIGSTSPLLGRAPGPWPVRSLAFLGHSPWQMLNAALQCFSSQETVALSGLSPIFIQRWGWVAGPRRGTQDRRSPSCVR